MCDVHVYMCAYVCYNVEFCICPKKLLSIYYFLIQMMDFFHSMTPEDKVIVFVGKKSRADDISSDLSLAGVDCQCIHGGREQCDREQALDDLKTGDVRILIATDVASRGIDIGDVT
jgi:ATP-dependent RNA helicase DDX43